MNIPTWAFDLAKGVLLELLGHIFDNKSNAITSKAKEIEELVNPIYAKMLVAARDEGLLGYLLDKAIPGDDSITYRLWKLRRPYDAQVTALLADKLKIYPRYENDQ